MDASTAAVVSIVATAAPVSHTRYTANIVVAGDRLWAATHAGLFYGRRDGSDGMIDVGGVVGELAVTPDAVWAVVHVADRGNDLVRVSVDDQRVTRLAVDDRIHGLVAGADGAWFVHVATNLMSHAAPDGGGIVDQVQLPGSLYGFGIGDEVVVAVVAVTHPGRKDGRVIGGVLRFDRTSGDLQGVTRRNGLCRALAVHGREAWIQMSSDEHVDPRDGTPLEDGTSVIECIDLDTGAVTDWVTVAEGINQLTGSSSGLWAKGFSRKAQRPWVARIDTGTGTTDAELLTRTSMPAHTSRARCTHAATEPSSRTSSWHGTADRPIFAAVASARARSRLVTMTRSPASTSAAAMASPRPLVAPVTNTRTADKSGATESPYQPGGLLVLRLQFQKSEPSVLPSPRRFTDTSEKGLPADRWLLTGA
ncbi:MAG TPA: hypothetical protein VHT30_03950 [Acidimicrobiales bacterium]|nr:hypothetical protein [Acidimicrobiales bacterium]